MELMELMSIFGCTVVHRVCHCNVSIVIQVFPHWVHGEMVAPLPGSFILAFVLSLYRRISREILET